MCRIPLSSRRSGHVFVVLALLGVAWAPRLARAQSVASNEGALVTVQHTLIGEVGAIVQARWTPWRRDAGLGAWSATVSVRSNVPVQTTAQVEGETVLSGWLVRTADGPLVPWDGRAIALGARLRPGESEVAVHVVPPAGAAEDVLSSVRLRVVPVVRP